MFGVRGFAVAFLMLTLGLSGCLGGKDAAPQSVAETTTGGSDESGQGTNPTPDIETPADVVPPDVGAIRAIALTDHVEVSWTVADASSVESRLDYGLTTSYGHSSPTRVGSGVHRIQLDGLEPATLYHYRIVATDAAGRETVSRDGAFFVDAAADQDAPVVSDVDASSITQSSAILSWTLEEDSGVVTSHVEYGTSQGTYPTATASRPGTGRLGTTVSGLMANTLYHYRISSTDGAGNEGTSADLTFRTLLPTDTRAPTVNGLGADAEQTTATVYWSAQDDSGAVDTRVRYGTSMGAYPMDSVMRTGTGSKAATLNHLTPDTVYYYRIRAVDGSNNVGTTPEASFRTDPPDDRPPTITAVSVTNLTRTQADVRWTVSDDEADVESYLRWGSGADSYTLGTSPIFLGNGDKAAALRNLTAGTTYHYRIYANDRVNGIVSTADVTFATPTPPPIIPTVVSDILVSDVWRDAFTVTFTVSGPSDVRAVVEYASNLSLPLRESNEFAGTGTYEYTIAGLADESLYYFRINATSSTTSAVTGFSNQTTARFLAIEIVANNKAESYDPTNITVPADLPLQVEVTNLDSGSHSWTIDDVAGSGVLEGDELYEFPSTFTIGAAGTYEYYCTNHPEMVGTLEAT